VAPTNIVQVAQIGIDSYKKAPLKKLEELFLLLKFYF